MNRSSRSFRPCADSLEVRALTSAVSLRAAPEISLLAKPNRLAITGTLKGNYMSTGGDMRAADAPLPVRLNASGKLTRLGRATLSGTLEFGGFLLAGRPDISGSVTLANARGSVTLRLTGSGGNGQIPGSRFVLDASIVSGTRAFTHVRGIGTVTACFGKDTIRCITTPCPIGGDLTLTVNLRPPVR